MITAQNNIEKEFIKNYENGIKEVNFALYEAEMAINKAVLIAEKYAIPIKTYISFVDNSYVPETFKVKYKDIDHDFVSNLTKIDDIYNDGWEVISSIEDWTNV